MAVANFADALEVALHRRQHSGGRADHRFCDKGGDSLGAEALNFPLQFIGNAKPPRNRFLFIPLGRPSSAKGYAQAQDPAWNEYEEETGGGLFKSRSDMKDALDFIGWYNHKSNEALGISKWDPKRMYLAYHEGRGGYSRGSYNSKPELIRIADRVSRQAEDYGVQLRQCEDRFRCRNWYEVGLFCN